jgi:hypothetical protein
MYQAQKYEGLIGKMSNSNLGKNILGSVAATLMAVPMLARDANATNYNVQEPAAHVAQADNTSQKNAQYAFLSAIDKKLAEKGMDVNAMPQAPKANLDDVLAAMNAEDAMAGKGHVMYAAAAPQVASDAGSVDDSVREQLSDWGKLNYDLSKHSVDQSIREGNYGKAALTWIPLTAVDVIKTPVDLVVGLANSYTNFVDAGKTDTEKGLRMLAYIMGWGAVQYTWDTLTGLGKDFYNEPIRTGSKVAALVAIGVTAANNAGGGSGNGGAGPVPGPIGPPGGRN